MTGDLREFTVEIAGRAADELMKTFRCLPAEAIGAKEQAHDLITTADHAAEAIILGAIEDRFPDHSILAEESGRRGPSEDPEYLWIVDPLDGTVNYVHGFPFFAVSIGLLHKGVPELGVVAAPALLETFVAERGKGCFLGETRLAVSTSACIADSLLTTGFAYEREGTPNPNLPNFARVLYRARAIRRPGSAALDLAYVAAGRFDGFWESHLSPWDVAAGALLVTEAGGRVTDFGLGPNWLYESNLLATNGLVHEELGEHLVFDPSLET